MRSKLALIVLVALCCLAGSAGAADCTESTEDCLCYFMEEMRDRGFAGLDLAPHDDDPFMTVTTVYNDTPAQRSGVLIGDDLVAINGIRFSDDAAVMEEIRALMVPGESIRFSLVREGRELDLELELVRMPEEMFFRMVGEHMLEHATIDVAAR